MGDRIRSIRIGIFTDDAYAPLSLAARLLLFGVLTQSDDEGVFAWKPGQLRRRILPDDHVDPDKLLQELTDSGFVRQFTHDGESYGCVRSFRREGGDLSQKPRRVHARGILPATLRDYVGIGAGSPEPEQLELDEPPPPKKRTPRRQPAKAPSGAELARLRDAYPVRAGTQSWDDARTVIAARLAEGVSLKDLAEGTTRYCRHCERQSIVGTQFVMTASRFYGKERHYAQTWQPEQKPSTPEPERTDAFPLTAREENFADLHPDEWYAMSPEARAVWETQLTVAEKRNLLEKCKDLPAELEQRAKAGTAAEI
ncbi:MAG: hypothetical protein OXC11_00725 [Rhodospirillales bacterium]|nr:hypothetical protein [Rhodospirillales bacterium]